jgi:hypothetical protein
VRLALLGLALCACRTEGAIGAVQVAGVGTLASGDAVVLLRQAWQNENGIYAKSAALVVDEGGQSEMAALPLPLLAPDCSDEPASLGACIAATKTMSGDFTTWTFDLGGAQGGDGIIASDAPTRQSVTLVDGAGSTLWTLFGVARPDDVIRGGALLVVNSRYVSATKIAVDSGAAIWSVGPPPSL